MTMVSFHSDFNINQLTQFPNLSVVGIHPRGLPGVRSALCGSPLAPWWVHVIDLCLFL